MTDAQKTAPRTVIESLGVYLPEKQVSTQEIVRGCARRLLVPLERLTGIRARHVAAEDEFAVDLARHAARRCLARSQYAAADVDLLVCTTISRLDGPQQFSFEPSTAARLCRDLGCTHALAMDLTNACAGMFTGILVADAMLRAGAIRRALIVSGEYITHLTRTAQKEIAGLFDPRLACLTLGDAGAAVMLTPGNGDEAGFHAIDLYTLGQYSGCCVAKPTDKPHGGAIMITDMVKLASVSLKHSMQHAAYTLSRLRWSPGAIQHVVPHQTSSTTIESGSKEIRRLVSDVAAKYNAHVVDNVAQRANTATTSHFVALEDCFAQDTIHSGDTVMFCVSASGITVGTAVYRMDNLPDRVRRNGVAHAQPAAAAPRHLHIAERGTRIGIQAIGTLDRAAPGPKNSLRLLTAAVDACMAATSLDRQEIDLLINASTYRTDFISEPAVGAMLAGEAHINDAVNHQLQKKTLAFDVMNGALGFLDGMCVAGELIRAGQCRLAMVAASEVENNAQVAPERLLGLAETASAVLLMEAAAGGPGFGACFFKSYPEHLDALETYGSFGTAAEGKPATPNLVVRRQADLECRWLECVADCVTQFLAAEGLSRSQIGLLLPPQISPSFVSGVATRLGFDGAQTVNVATAGQDLFTSSIPYSLQAALRDHRPAPGTIGLVVAVASGLQVGCALYHF